MVRTQPLTATGAPSQTSTIPYLSIPEERNTSNVPPWPDSDRARYGRAHAVLHLKGLEQTASAIWNAHFYPTFLLRYLLAEAENTTCCRNFWPSIRYGRGPLFIGWFGWFFGPVDARQTCFGPCRLRSCGSIFIRSSSTRPFFFLTVILARTYYVGAR